MGKKAFSHQPLAVRKSDKTNKENKINRSSDLERIAAMKSRLRKGEIAEALFVAKALGLGMNVSKPFGQNCRYDFMVEVMGKAVRVQVKSTWQKKVSSFLLSVSRKSDQPSAVSRQGEQLPSPRMDADERGPESQRPSPQRTPFGAPQGRLRYTKEDTKEERQYVVRAGGTGTRGARRYRASEVDYIAAYVGPENEWYVIPVGKIPSAFTIVLPGRYARYREAWDQLCPRGVVVGDIQACADPNARCLTAEDAEDAETASSVALRVGACPEVSRRESPW